MEKKYYSINKAVNTYRLLENIEIPHDQNYTIYAYILYEQPMNGEHGYQIYLGSYPTREEAVKKAKEIIELTEHSTIYVCKTCQWEKIDEKKDIDRTNYVPISKHPEKLDKIYYEQLEKEQKAKIKREKIMKGIEEQQQKELDPNSIENYVNNWFLAIKNYKSYQYHIQKATHFKKMFMNRKKSIKKQYKEQPEYEEQWENIYKKRLQERGEMDVFLALQKGHSELKEKILN